MVMDICNAENEDVLVLRIENVINAITQISAVSLEDSRVILMSVIATLAMDLKRSNACVPLDITMVVDEKDNDKN